MKTLSESDYRKYKKLIIAVTHEMENVSERYKNIMEMKENFINNGIKLTKEQIHELVEYENRTRKCLDTFLEY